MAVRELDGTDDDIQIAIGALSGMTHGTVAVIVKRTALVGFDALFVAHTSGGTRRLQVSFVGNETNWYPGSGPTDSRGPLVNNTADWWLIVARKATGTVAPRYSVYNFGSDIWVHADGSNALPDSATPGADGTVRFTMQGGEHLPALVAVRAAWSNALPWSANVVGDVAIEVAGLETAYQNWIDASPTAAWRFNQDVVSTAVVDDTGNGADQTAITGTTVVVGDDPPGFDFSLSSGITGSAASIAPVGHAEAVGAVTVTGSSAAVAPAAVASGSGAVGNPSRTGSAASVAAGGVVAGSATVAVAGSGAATAPAGLATGAGQALVSGAAASVALAGIASGSAVHGTVVLTGTIHAAASRVPTAMAAQPRTPSATTAVSAVPTAGGAP